MKKRYYYTTRCYIRLPTSEMNKREIFFMTTTNCFGSERKRKFNYYFISKFVYLDRLFIRCLIKFHFYLRVLNFKLRDRSNTMSFSYYILISHFWLLFRNETTEIVKISKFLGENLNSNSYYIAIS